MQMTAQQSQQNIVAAHPLTQLLECPPETSLQLGRSVRTLQFEEGDAIFRQDAPCAGLYLLVSGNFLRRVERMGTRLTLAPGSPGDLSGVGGHTWRQATHVHIDCTNPGYGLAVADGNTGQRVCPVSSAPNAPARGVGTRSVASL